MSFVPSNVAGTFGSDTERYDRARPTYPSELVSRVVAGRPGLDVLDVGTGTGIVARQFRDAGCRVLGVELDQRMAEFARREGFTVEVAKFEDWSPAGRSFDAVVAGQTWHWVEPLAGAARAAEALRTGGRLAVFWNAGAVVPELAAAFAHVYERVAPGSFLTRQWTAPTITGYERLATKAVEGFAQAGTFDAPEEWRFDWERDYSHDEWLDQVPTQGGHSQLSPEQLDAVLAGIGAAIDGVGGGFTMSYTTLTVTACVTG